MERIELTALIGKNGKMEIPLRNRLVDWCNVNIGRNVKLIFEVHRKVRSSPQNRYYWGVCVPLIQEAINNLGHNFTKEETHEYLKKEFNSKEVDLHNGYFLQVPGSTTEMNTVDFMAFIARIQQFAAEILDIKIPDPGQELEFQF